MLQKLRSRHPIDLPQGEWKRSRGILAVLGGTALLFVLVPLLLSPLAQLNESARKALVLLGASVAMLVVVLLIGALKGKTGWQR